MSRPKNNICIDGRKVKELREGLDLSQEAFVGLDSVSLSLSSLQRIERDSMASREHAYQIAGALGVRLQDLLAPTDNAVKPNEGRGSSEPRIRVLVAIGNILGKYTNLSRERVDRIKAIADSLREEFSNHERFDFMISGRDGSLAVEIFQDFQHEDIKRVNTFIPKMEIEKSLPSGSYVMLGNVFEAGDYIEDRRQALLDNSDIVLISDGKRGVTNLLSLAEDQNRKIIPLPFGVETDGDFTEACAKFEDLLRKQCNQEPLQSWTKIKSISTSPKDVAASVCNLIEAFHHRTIKRNIAFIFSRDAEIRQDFEAAMLAVKQLAQEVGFSILSVDSRRQPYVISEDVVEAVLDSEACVAIVMNESPTLHAIMGIAAGSGKKLVFAQSQGCTLQYLFQYSGFEHLIWDTPDSLVTQLNATLQVAQQDGEIRL